MRSATPSEVRMPANSTAIASDVIIAIGRRLPHVTGCGRLRSPRTIAECEAARACGSDRAAALVRRCADRGRSIATSGKRLAVEGTQRLPDAASHSRTAFSSIASNTGARSPGEELMTCKTSAVAVCCSKASRVSVSSRAFSIAMTACAAKFCRQRDLLVGEWPDLLPINANDATVLVLAERHGQGACARRRDRPVARCCG